MITITASQVKELRDATNVSMMECKKALEESSGDMDGATKLLRERGMAVAAKRATKQANQGIIATAATPDGNTFAMVEVNCETDFVARNPDFVKFVNDVAEKALAADTQEALENSLNDVLMGKIAAIGEKLKIRRSQTYRRQGTGTIAPYVHLGGKVGVLVELSCTVPASVDSPLFQDLARDLTLQIAAATPRFIQSDEIPAAEIEAERAIYAKQVEGKPAAVVEKIVDGKLQKLFFAETCLLEQGFVREPKQTIRQLLAETGKTLNDTLTIRRFTRFQLGQ